MISVSSAKSAVGVALQLVGVATISFIGLTYCKLIRKTFLNSGINLKEKYGRFGSWAVVTGASEGIGLSFARDLAKRGFNVCIIALAGPKLDEAVAEIQTHKVKGLAISFDFAATDEAAYAELFKKLNDLDVSILVNNVGITTGHCSLFGSYTINDDLRVLSVNCAPQMQMCKYVIPKLQGRGGGAIVNISSISATFERMPYVTTYTATKAFNRIFSKSLEVELREYNIDVLTVTPGFVTTTAGRTGMLTAAVALPAPPGSVPSDEMAHDSLCCLGVYTETSGHRDQVWTHFHQLLYPESYIVPSLLKMVKRRSMANPPGIQPNATVA